MAKFNLTPELKDAIEGLIETFGAHLAVYHEDIFRNHESLSDWSDEQIDEHINNSNKREGLKYKVNQKYIRIDKEQGSTVAFIDEQGNVMKPASFRSPVPGSRGNILSDNPYAAFNMNDSCISVKTYR